MMKILHVLTDTNLGGAGRCLLNYLSAADKMACSITVALPRGSVLVKEVEQLGFPVIETDGIGDRSFSAAGVPNLWRVIRREQPDLVHTHGALSGRLAAKLRGKRVVYTRHCAFPVSEKLKKGPGHWLCGAVNSILADEIIAISPAAKENLMDMGVPEKKITVMMNGAPALKPASREQCEAMREKLGIPPETFTAGILARLEPYKGHRTLLEAARMLKDEGKQFRILVGGSGPEEENLKKRVRAMDLSEEVQFLGFVEDVAQVLSILDLQLNCSMGTETSSLSIIEGMSLGLPTLASDYGGNPWLVDQGVTGLLYETGNNRDLFEKLKLLMTDEQMRYNMGENALWTYYSRFTNRRMAEDVEAVYRKARKER